MLTFPRITELVTSNSRFYGRREDRRQEKREQNLEKVSQSQKPPTPRDLGFLPLPTKYLVARLHPRHLGARQPSYNTEGSSITLRLLCLAAIKSTPDGSAV
jgi:hypothetical protein